MTSRRIGRRVPSEASSGCSCRGFVKWSSLLVALGAALVGCGGSTSSSAKAPTSTSASTTTAPARTKLQPVVLSQRNEAPLPSAVQEVAAASTATRFYIIGGYDATGSSVSSVFVYDGARWADGPTLPIAVNHPAAAALNGNIYVAGGFTSGSATSRVFRLAPGASMWQEVASMHTARAATAVLAIGRYLYAIGGIAGTTQIGSVERYNPTTDTWTDITQMPRPRNHVAGYVDGKYACVAGGREPATSNAVDCLDTTTTTWKPGIPLPVPTSGAAAGIVDGVLSVSGGEPSGETSLVPLVQELRTISWTTQAMLVPRHGTGYAEFQQRLWMCGGATAAGYHATTACTSLGT